MMEPSFGQELQCIRETDHLQYIIVMIVWFQHWRQDQGWWPSLLACNFQVGASATINIETRVLSIILQVNMSQGEKQVLQVLTTLQYLAEVGLKSPPPGHIMHSIQSIIRPLEQTEISFIPHTVLGLVLQFNLVLQSKQMYHVQTYCHCPPVYAQQVSCLTLSPVWRTIRHLSCTWYEAL